jgi:hypothetical protein
MLRTAVYNHAPEVAALPVTALTAVNTRETSYCHLQNSDTKTIFCQCCKIEARDRSIKQAKRMEAKLWGAELCANLTPS